MSSPGSQSAEALARKPLQLPTIGGKYFALVVLFTMNLLNYVDRYSFFAAGTHIQKDLHINDDWFGVLGVSFMIVYTLISPPMGWLGDRYNRKLLLAGGVGLWSFATVGAAFSTNFGHMFFWRALLGVGEASYGVIAPALISDLFPVHQRGRAMGVYYLGLPVGTALGYLIGGSIADLWGWQAVFFVVGFPGLIAALAGLVMSDPGRGASEGVTSKAKSTRTPLSEYLDLFKTKTFVYNTAGMAAVTFATGAYAAWGSTFYQREFNLTATEAGKWIGLLLVTAGLIGIGLGMVLPDLLQKLTKKAYLLLCAFAVLGATPLAAAGILYPHYGPSLGLMFMASILMAMVLGPSNTVTANVVPAHRRAMAYSVFIFLIHFFGDISSPILVGKISTIFGTPAVANSPVGKFFESWGAGPVLDPSLPEGVTNLSVGMLSVIPILAIGFVLFLIGSRYLPGDQDKVRGKGETDLSGPGFFHH
jgi:MFS transporter, Spinster family, sphingosine-1-phosphate transporter